MRLRGHCCAADDRSRQALSGSLHPWPTLCPVAAELLRRPRRENITRLAAPHARVNGQGKNKRRSTQGDVFPVSHDRSWLAPSRRNREWSVYCPNFTAQVSQGSRRTAAFHSLPVWLAGCISWTRTSLAVSTSLPHRRQHRLKRGDGGSIDMVPLQLLNRSALYPWCVTCGCRAGPHATHSGHPLRLAQPGARAEVAQGERQRQRLRQRIPTWAPLSCHVVKSLRSQTAAAAAWC